MMREVVLKLSPADAADAELVRKLAIRRAGKQAHGECEVRIVRRSIDARKFAPKIVLSAEVYSGAHKPERRPSELEQLRRADPAKKVLIVGAGPAGYFAALELLRHGITPIVLDRGKDVRARRRDLRAIQQFGRVNPHSNYCFGEGGAGTYSDGKLYTNSRKRGDIQRVLRILVEHGAQEDILIDAHPHIGSNKLPKVVENIRRSIEAHGGAVHFNTLVEDILIDDGRACGVAVSDCGEQATRAEERLQADAVILAAGHSARDIFTMLQRRGIAIEAKPFGIGLRIEHPQALIDEIQYNQRPRSPYLPAASYKLVTHVEERGVFSFCMCPGGLIVPAATAPGEIVVNGMSMSRRDSAYANSGIVVALELDDFKHHAQHGALAGMRFQREIEQRMFAAGDGTQRAPGQTVTDFLQRRQSGTLPGSSYIPGLFSAPVHELLPPMLSERLGTALKHFGRKLRGFNTAEAVLVGVESRTSSPVRIPRSDETREHVNVKHLFPCGEGAGYAGGIVSAALDGVNVARSLAATVFGCLIAE